MWHNEQQGITSFLNDGKGNFKKDIQALPIETEAGSVAVSFDADGDKVTPTLGANRECAYALYDDRGILKCGIEQAYLDGKISWKKPISCHLYPIRVTKYDQYDALNYNRWHICDPACQLGKSLQVPLYTFLKEALVRKYGAAWYAELVEDIEGSKKA